MAEPIEVPLGIWTQIGLRNIVLNECPDLHTGEQFWARVCRPIVMYREDSACGRYLQPYLAGGWLGSRVVSVLDSGAESPGLNRSRDAVG